MKKILFLFVALIMSVCSAMADNITSLEQAQADALYTIHCDRGYLTIDKAMTKLYGSNEGTSALATNFDAENDAFQFKFVQEGGNYYLYSVAAQKYVKVVDKVGTLVGTTGEADVIGFRSWDTTVQPWWEKATASKNLNLGGSMQVVIDGWQNKDAGNKFEITKLEILDYTVTVEGLTGQGGVSYKGTDYASGETFKAAVANVALFAPVVVDGYDATISVVDNAVTVTYTRPAVSPGNYVSFLNKGHNLYLGVNANGTQLSSTTAYTKANAWQLVADGTNYKLYNPESDVYAGKITSRNGAIATVSEENAGVYTIATYGNYYTLKCTNGTYTGYDYFHQVNWGGNAVVDWNASADASQWTIALVEYTPSVKYDVTYNYLFEGDNVGSETLRVDAGAEYPDPILAFYGYTKSAKPEGNVTENCSADITLTWDDLFKVTTITDGQFAPSTKWYFLENGKNKVNGYAVFDNNAAAKSTFTTSAGSSDSYKWCFVRKPGTAFFYLYNKQAGAATPLREQLSSNASYAASHNQGYCVINETGTNEMAIKLEANGSGFAFRLAGVDGTCLLGKHVGNNLSIWGNGASLTDDGSRFVISEVPDVFHYSVVIAGAPAGETPQITVGENTYATGAEFDSDAAIAQSDIHATEYTGYSSNITVENYVITVTYTVKAISQLSELVQGQVYTITAGGTRGAFVYTANGLSSTTKESIAANETSENQQFLFVQKDGAYYLYSVGAHAFINVTGQNSNNNRAVACGAKPVNTTLELLANQHSSKATHPVVLSIDGHHVGVSNGFTPAVITHYNSLNDEGNSLRILPVVGTTVDVTDILVAMDALDWDAYQAKIDLLKEYEGKVGTALGQYSVEIGGYAMTAEWFADILEYYQDICDNEGDGAYEEEDIDIDMMQMQDILANLHLNTPKHGQLIRIKTSGNWIATPTYLAGETTSVATKTDRLAFVQPESFDPWAEDNTVWVYYDKGSDGQYLVNYANGLTAANKSTFLGLDMYPKTTRVEFLPAANGAVGKYNIRFVGSRYLYTNNDLCTDAGNSPTAEGYNFELEDATSYFQLSYSDKGWATGYFPIDVAANHEYGIEAAYVINTDPEEGYFKANEINGCIPAFTPVVLKVRTDESFHPFVKGAPDSNSTPLPSVLSGALWKQATPANSYVFNVLDGEPGFYKYTGETLGHMKAYYVAPAATASALRINFGDDTLTGIMEAIEKEQFSGAIYDLQGRRINGVQNGVFVKNGKKVVK